MKRLMDHFDRTCQTFTTVNAYKYQIQYYLLHNTNNAAFPSVLHILISIVTGLQAAAEYLQEVAISEVISASIQYHGQISIIYVCVYIHTYIYIYIYIYVCMYNIIITQCHYLYRIQCVWSSLPDNI